MKVSKKDKIHFTQRSKGAK